MIGKKYEIRINATDNANLVSAEVIFKINLICTRTISVLSNPIPATTTYDIPATLSYTALSIPTFSIYPSFCNSYQTY